MTIDTDPLERVKAERDLALEDLDVVRQELAETRSELSEARSDIDALLERDAMLRGAYRALQLEKEHAPFAAFFTRSEAEDQIRKQARAEGFREGLFKARETLLEEAKRFNVFVSRSRVEDRYGVVVSETVSRNASAVSDLLHQLAEVIGDLKV
jgi:hypothetical protein